MATLSARLDLLEVKHAAKIPMLPALVLMSNQDPDAERAQFIAKHGRAPVHVLVIRRVSAQVKQTSAEDL